MNIADILQYGVIGLGFLLAVLAYRLLSSEQRVKIPRKKMLYSIYVFMLFSVTLCVIGFYSLIHSDQIFEEQKKVTEARYAIENNLKKFEAVGMKNIRKYVNPEYSDEFIKKVVRAYPEKFEMVTMNDSLDPVGIKLKTN